jgi:hypothetical protein
MSNPTPKASVLIVTVPQRMTKQQREDMVASIAPHLPPDVGCLVLDGGITGQVVGRATLRRWFHKRRSFNSSSEASE